MEPFKNIYNKGSITYIAQETKKAYKSFDEDGFIKAIVPKLKDLEMKDRVRLISKSYHEFLPKDYKKAIKILIKTLSPIDNETKGLNGFSTWPIGQFIEDYGIDHFEQSMDAIYELTRRFTSEFAIRPYLIKYPTKTYKKLNEWKKDECHHVRRLVSEGSRPNLPWGLKIPKMNEYLAKNVKLLNSLKNDESEYVRKSVANHLNDISRIDKDLMIKTCESWYEDTKERKWLIRHACRTLLKAGDKRVLKLHGYDPELKVTLKKT